VHELEDGDDFGRLVDAALASDTPPTVLGIYGGDGSVSALAGIARKRQLPLLAFPGGTFNHFTRAADIDSVDQAIDALIAGSGRAVDVGELTFAHGDPITVLNTASVGLYPAFVEEREKNEKRLGKPLAAVIAAIRVVRTNEPLEVQLNGDERSRVFTVFIGIGRYFPVTAAPIERRRLDDGVLDVRILRADRKPRTRGALALALGGRTDKLAARLPFMQGPPVLDAFTTSELSLVSRVLDAPGRAEASGTTGDPDGGDPGYAHDGEAAPQTPGGEDALGGHALTVRLVPAGLRIYAPV
jgi:undecaprenyl-diphosphatase